MWLKLNNYVLLNSDILILGTDQTMLDFWQWGFSNILTNNLRGIFAEFLVGAVCNGGYTSIRLVTLDAEGCPQNNAFIDVIISYIFPINPNILSINKIIVKSHQ
jgi:hypothetical protein